MRKGFLHYLLFFSLFLTACGSSQKIAEDALHLFEKNLAISGSVYGIHVIDLQTGKTRVDVNKNKLLIPASTMKTLYVFESLKKYGENYRFKTSLLISGKKSKDTLYGNVIIRANNDPTLGGSRAGEDFRDFMDSIAFYLKKEGIRTVKGNLYLQLPAAMYPAHGSWPLEDLGNYYGSGTWGFNFNDNTYYIYLQQENETGKTVSVHHTEPSIPGLVLLSHVKTAGKDTGDNAYIYGDPKTYYRNIFGTIPAGKDLFKIKGAIPDVPRTFLRILKPYLKNRGIYIEGTKQVQNKHRSFPDEKVLWVKYSPPLSQMARLTLNYSINHYSEALARLVIEGEYPGEGYLSKDSINAYFHNIGFQNIDLEDGCGLAPDNLIAPSEYTRYLYALSREKGLDWVLSYLPRAGEDGYAKYFLQNSPRQSKVWLKSGSVSKVRNYIGIFRGKSGRYYAFAIMVNHFKSKHKEVKKAIEHYLEKIIGTM